jgi:peptide/nickel transport system ATP-binding protein
MTPLLAVRGLTVCFGRHVAVDALDLTIETGSTLAVVGESGSGKSTLARAIAGLVRASAGTMLLDGVPLEGLAPRKDPRHRLAIQMVFQNPDAALNPRRSIRQLIEEPLMMLGRERVARHSEATRLMRRVGLSEDMMVQRPHNLSGGQRQRVCIARALAAEPRLMIADEAVSALDVSIQGQILNLFADLQREFGLAWLYISHDLSVVQHVADRVMVLYAGQIMEVADAAALWRAPTHPYTRALMAAAPVPEPALARARRREAAALAPAEIAPSTGGCPYRGRCALASDVCARQRPPLRTVGGDPGDHAVACHHAAEVRSAPGLMYSRAPTEKVSATSHE